jgi:hypothetical protein
MAKKSLNQHKYAAVPNKASRKDDMSDQAKLICSLPFSNVHQRGISKDNGIMLQMT